MKCPIRNHRNQSPLDPAVVENGMEYSYLDLDQKITDFCSLLSDSGVKTGMRVSILPDNSFRYIALIFALLRRGCTVVPVNFRLSPGEIDAVHREMGVGVQFEQTGNKNRRAPGVKRLDSDKNPVSLTGKTLILTSGSTGRAKGVLLSMENHYFSALGANRNMVLNSGDKWYLKLPLFHVGGLAVLFRAFLAGASVVIPSEKKENMLAELDMLQVTHVSLVQSQLVELLRDLVRSGKKAPGSLRAVLAGGSALSGSVLAQSFRLGVPVYKTYGLSEMGSQVTATAEPVTEKNANTSGTLLNYRELMIGPVGEILVKGKTLFQGYISGGIFSPAELDDRGWFDTGDRGYLNEDGSLVVTGRGDNMFISGGENIFPEEIEKELLNLNCISEAVVVPVDHPEFGKRPVAFVRLYSHRGRLSEIVGTLQQKLARFKIPDRFFHLPAQEGGKLKQNRKDLEAAATSGIGLEEILD